MTNRFVSINVALVALAFLIFRGCTSLGSIGSEAVTGRPVDAMIDLPLDVAPTKPGPPNLAPEFICRPVSPELIAKVPRDIIPPGSKNPDNWVLVNVGNDFGLNWDVLALHGESNFITIDDEPSVLNVAFLTDGSQWFSLGYQDGGEDDFWSDVIEMENKSFPSYD